jgi:hypothetical protein
MTATEMGNALLDLEEVRIKFGGDFRVERVAPDIWRVWMEPDSTTGFEAATFPEAVALAIAHHLELTSTPQS